MTHSARVVCPTCGLDETFEKLADARLRIERHRTETGHDPDWELESIAPGVERAGDLAVVCGECHLGDESPFSPAAADDAVDDGATLE